MYVFVLLITYWSSVSAFTCSQGSVYKDDECQKCSPGRFFSGKTPIDSVHTGWDTHNEFPVDGIPECYADCDDDTQCAPGLRCFQRNHGEPFTGCLGLAGSNPYADYCIRETPQDLSTESFMYNIDCDIISSRPGVDVDRELVGLCSQDLGHSVDEVCGGDPLTNAITFTSVSTGEDLTTFQECQKLCTQALKDNLLGNNPNSDMSMTLQFAAFKTGTCKCYHLSDNDHCSDNDNWYSTWEWDMVIFGTYMRHRRLQECEGSCESNLDCAGSLVCHTTRKSQSTNDYTPGCNHINIENDVTVCYNPTKTEYECVDCEKSTYQPNEGSMACVQCPDNTYTLASGRKECLACSAIPAPVELLSGWPAVWSPGNNLPGSYFGLVKFGTSDQFRESGTVQQQIAECTSACAAIDTLVIPFGPWDVDYTIRMEDVIEIRLEVSQYECPAMTFFKTGNVWRGSAMDGRYVIKRELRLTNNRLFCHNIGGSMSPYGNYDLSAPYLKFKQAFKVKSVTFSGRTCRCMPVSRTEAINDDRMSTVAFGLTGIIGSDLGWTMTNDLENVFLCCPGYAYDNGTCVECPAGQMSSGQKPCQPCGLRQVATKVLGQYREYGKNGSSVCEDCPEGKQVVNNECRVCAPGQITFEDFRFGAETVDENCTKCPAGSFESPGYLGKLEVCRLCPTGFYAEEGSTLCEACGQNTYASSWGMESCLDCPNGKRSPTASAICNEDCPAGTFESGLQNCIRCQPGKYVELSFSYKGVGLCNGAIGIRVYNGASDNPGTDSTSNQRECAKACKSQSTALEYGPWSTRGTALGFSVDAVGRCYCNHKTWSGCMGSIAYYTAYSFYDFADIVCEACPNGQVKEFDYLPACTVCTGRTIASIDQTRCEFCPAGKYFSEDSCKECGQGTYADPQGKSLTSCKNCPSGYTQQLTGQGNCSICELGKYSETQIQCLDCVPGQISNVLGAAECFECPEGTGADGTIRCIGCQAGYGTVVGTCTACEKGKYSITGICNDCLRGSFSNSVATTLCEKCPTGYYSRNTSRCDTCDASNDEYPNLFGEGSYYCMKCSDPTVACQQCGPGTYSNGQECNICPSGRVNNGNRVCQECTQYMVPDKDSSQCIFCPPGFEKQDFECVACPPGKHGASIQCLECSKGRFSSDPQVLQCAECPVGKTTSSYGAISNTDCQTCQGLGYPTSHVVIESECSKCVEGYVFNTNTMDCEECPVGQYRSSAQIACTECIAGQFSKNNEPCQECPTGYYNIDAGQSDCQICLQDCQVCAAGYRKLAESCQPCESGKYSISDQVQCVDCSAGQYQPAIASKNCINCPQGLSQDVLGQSNCKQCAIGHFQGFQGQGACHACPISKFSSSTASFSCEDCPVGRVTLSEASVSATDCIPCPPGSLDVSGTCVLCPESNWQDLNGQTTCKSCPSGKMSAKGSTSVENCFSLQGMFSYVFGMKIDSKSVQKYTKTCEVRPNSVLLCPSCSCDSDSRNGFWSSPICDECQRGFATRTCKVKCAGYNGISDDTMCNGKGKCWYGKFGSGLCYCGGLGVLDSSSDSVVVDTRVCPKGQICAGYGQFQQQETVYRPIYYMVLYRQYSAFVLKLSEYTPRRGHMWFKRYNPTNAYENDCQACVGTHQQDSSTSIGYWSAVDKTYTYWPDEMQTNNGFHGPNCQYECAVCLNGGRCENVPHSYTYRYGIVNTYRPQRAVTIPSTFCVCPSISMDPSHMCCPNGFQPYVYLGPKNSKPYSRYTNLPFVSSVINERTDSGFAIGRDIFLEPDKDVEYYKPLDGMQWESRQDGTFARTNYSSVGAYNTHSFYGSAKDICRPCPGLFGRGVRSESKLIKTSSEATDFWWDNAIGAQSRKCNGVGVCDFYAKDREMQVHFMGNADSFFKEAIHYVCDGPSSAYSFYEDSEGVEQPIETIQQCAELSKAGGRERFAYIENYRGGSQAMVDNTTFTHKVYAELHATTLGSTALAVKDGLWYVVLPDVSIPSPDITSQFEVHPVRVPKCLTYASCVEKRIQSGYGLYRHEQGRGVNRGNEASYDRFDTCFTYTWNAKKSIFGLYVTKDYIQGEDPYLGGLCPPGYICSVFESLAYKEECPIGYYQPEEGMTRTRVDVQCSSRTNAMDACKPKLTTKNEHDYVDTVCKRCPRNTWAPAGSRECLECPVGRVKKISGVFDISTDMLNMPKAVSSATAWYYQENEHGSMLQDCALVPASLLHVSEANDLLTYDLPQFLPVLSCPYGYSTQPGSYIRIDSGLYRDIIESNIPQSLVMPPFMKMEVLYQKTSFSETCSMLDLTDINSFESCQQAAQSLGIQNVKRRVGIFEGCWYMPNIDPSTVFWGVAGTRKCVPSLQYICQQNPDQSKAWPNFVRNSCFRCPGKSVNGPEYGTCDTCPGNNVKGYMKETIQKFAEGGLLEMVTQDGTDVLLEPNVILNINLQEITCSHESPSFVLTPKFSGKTTLSDCYIACQSLATQQAPDSLLLEGSAKTNFLRAIKVEESFPFKCSCATVEDVRSNCSASSSSGWQDISWLDWDVAQPLCSSCEPGKFTKVLNVMANTPREAIFRSICVLCPTGYYTSNSVESSSASCVSCLSGRYQDETGQKECKSCPSGFYQIYPEKLSCNACQNGKYQSQLGMSFCRDCPNGYLAPETGQFECRTCPVGYYQDSQSLICTACLPGQYQDVDGSLTCKPCPTGRFTTQTNTSSCSLCQTGKYQTQTGQISCTKCGQGAYQNEFGANAQCKECPSGWTAPGHGYSVCDPCPGAYECQRTYVFDDPVTDKCSEGTYIAPLTWALQCSSCEAEQVANENGTGCISCPSGKSTYGMQAFACQDCPDEGWLGISNWNGVEYQTQQWEEVSRYSTKPTYTGSTTDGLECNDECNDGCGDGLTCFERGLSAGREPVPGCALGLDITRWPAYKDLCYKPYDTLKVYKTSTNPSDEMSECVGPCAMDSDCATGLVCHIRYIGEQTPGCEGTVSPTTNICYDPSGARNMAQGFVYASTSNGLCVDTINLPEGSFPPLLSYERRLYNYDRTQECMNRCLDAYPGSRGFSLRVTDDRCTCSTGACAQQTSSNDFQTFHIFEATEFVQTYSSYAVALSDGTRKLQLVNPSEITTLSISHADGTTTTYSTSETLTIEQFLSAGEKIRLEITCKAEQEPYNCHFRIQGANAGDHNDLRFYKRDPGSNYCTL